MQGFPVNDFIWFLVSININTIHTVNFWGDNTSAHQLQYEANKQEPQLIYRQELLLKPQPCLLHSCSEQSPIQFMVSIMNILHQMLKNGNILRKWGPMLTCWYANWRISGFQLPDPSKFKSEDHPMKILVNSTASVSAIDINKDTIRHGIWLATVTGTILLFFYYTEPLHHQQHYNDYVFTYLFVD